MNVTFTCQEGCTASTSMYERPGRQLAQQVPDFHCACGRREGRPFRNPYESEFIVEYQQVIQSLEDKCISTVESCSFGTPFEVGVLVTLEHDQDGLIPDQIQQAANALMAASNTAYAATNSNYRPEFRQFDQVAAQAVSPPLHRQVEASQSDEPSKRLLQKRTQQNVKISMSGVCNLCGTKNYYGNDVYTSTKTRRARTRRLQQQQATWHASSCFCPLGSTIQTEPLSPQSLIEMFQKELGLRGIPITNVTKMVEVDASPLPPLANLNPIPVSTPTTQPTPSTSSSCPLVKLDFMNLYNPMARYYGQNNMLRAGDYLYDQPWWTHGVRVSARIRNSTDATSDDRIFIPQFKRGTGWIDSKQSHKVNDPKTGGAIRLFDTTRPTYGIDVRSPQPLCSSNGREVNSTHLGAPNADCGAGPGKCFPFPHSSPFWL